MLLRAYICMYALVRCAQPCHPKSKQAHLAKIVFLGSESFHIQMIKDKVTTAHDLRMQHRLNNPDKTSAAAQVWYLFCPPALKSLHRRS